MKSIRSKHPGLAAGLLCLLVAGSAAADWSFRRGTVESTNRQEVPADLDAAPGIANIHTSDRRALPGRRVFVDGNRDGSLDVLMPFRGSLGLFDPAADAFAWVSPNLGIDGLVGLGDFDGDGDSAEVLATAAQVGGGIYIIDLQSGALMASITGLSEGSGVDSDELALYDFDGDGRPEIVFASGIAALPKLWVASFEEGYASYSLLELDYTGYANSTGPRVGTLFPDGGVGIVLNQGYNYSLWSPCEPSEPEALCDPQTGQLCFCAAGGTEQVNALLTIVAPPHEVDVDGDGDEELVEIAGQGTWARVVQLLDFELAFEDDEPDGAAARVWAWDHAAQDPLVQANAPETDPVDLDGDGDLDVIVNFANNGNAEVDADGDPADDGLDRVGGVGAVLYDGPSGDVLLTLPDTFVWGTEDLDGDGIPELVTSPAPAWSFEAELSGRQLVCDADCSAEPVWTRTGVRLAPDLADFDGRALPTPHLQLTEADGDDQPELVVYGPGGPEIVEPDGAGGLSQLAAVAAADPYTIEGATNGGLVLSSDVSLQSFDTDLAPTSGAVEVPPQGFSAWRAAAISAGGPWVTTVGHDAFWDDGGPRVLDMGGPAAFVQDLDGDGLAEIVAYANAGVDDADGLRVRVYAWTGGDFSLRWEMLADDVPALVGARAGNDVHFAPGDFDGAGALDVAFSGSLAGVPHVFILDGDTGALDAVLNPSGRSASLSTFRPADVVDAAGLAGTNGIDDILHLTSSRVEVLSQGHDAPLFDETLQVFGSVSAWADLDGDGSDEFFVSVLSTLVPRGQALRLDGADPEPYWGPIELGPMTATQDLMSFSALDDEPGLDILYLNGDGSLTARAGTTGDMLPGYPLYLDGGTLPTTPPVEIDVPTSIVVLDVDDDGFDEAVVGTRLGWLYALDLDPSEVGAPSLLWSVQLPAGVGSIGASDNDGDGYSDLMVAIDDRSVVILAGSAVSLEFTGPDPTDCYGEARIEFQGIATGITTVRLFANGVLGEEDIDATDGSWAGSVTLSSAGTYAMRADGFDAGGALVAVAFMDIEFEGDDDLDGTTECGGDCAPTDPQQGPLVEEICDDGIDQDCDGEDLECPDVDDDDSADADDSADDDDATVADDSAVGAAEGCSCDCEGNIGGGRARLAFLLPVLMLWGRRRNRS